jgi:hypothetical protein
MMDFSCADAEDMAPEHIAAHKACQGNMRPLSGKRRCVADRSGDHR